MDEQRDEEDEDLRRKKKRQQKRLDREDRERRRRSRKPHRGGLILVLGILSIVFSCAFVIAWILGWRAINMANEDLDAMSAGRMDSTGQGMTQTGKICGIIGAILGGIGLIVAVVLTITGSR